MEIKIFIRGRDQKEIFSTAKAIIKTRKPRQEKFKIIFASRTFPGTV